MTKQKRLAAVLLAALLLLAVTASLFVVAYEADHNCIGEDCPVCAVISSCRKVLRTLGGILAAAGAVVACRSFAAAVIDVSRAVSCRTTPITLKDKLLN